MLQTGERSGKMGKHRNGYGRYWRALVGDKGAVDLIREAQRRRITVLELLLRAHLKAAKAAKAPEEREALGVAALKHLPGMHDEITAVVAMDAQGDLKEPQEGPQQPQGAAKPPKGLPT